MAIGSRTRQRSVQTTGDMHVQVQVRRKWNCLLTNETHPLPTPESRRESCWRGCPLLGGRSCRVRPPLARCQTACSSHFVPQNAARRRRSPTRPGPPMIHSELVSFARGVIPRALVDLSFGAQPSQKACIDGTCQSTYYSSCARNQQIKFNISAESLFFPTCKP